MVLVSALADSALTEPAPCSLWLSVVVIVTGSHCLIQTNSLLRTGSRLPAACMEATPRSHCQHPCGPQRSCRVGGPVSSTRVTGLPFLSSCPFSRPARRSVTHITGAAALPGRAPPAEERNRSAVTARTHAPWPSPPMHVLPLFWLSSC